MCGAPSSDHGVRDSPGDAGGTSVSSSTSNATAYVGRGAAATEDAEAGVVAAADAGTNASALARSEESGSDAAMATFFIMGANVC